MKYTPFDDSQSFTRPPQPTESGYDTSGWDPYRQGVEISSNKFRFLGTQPKVWSGETSGFVDLVTYGQEPGSIDGNALGLESKFEDLPRFDPVSYISMGVAYPLPITFNEGASQENEASIEPLTIPFKKPSNEGRYHAHDVRGDLEDGNLEGLTVRSANVITQFIDLKPASSTRFFLDEGAGIWGSLPREAYIADVEVTPTPFDDTVLDTVDRALQTDNETIANFSHEGALKGNSFLPYATKSATAGYSYYGLNAGRYGTDSIAFGGWSLGS